ENPQWASPASEISRHKRSVDSSGLRMAASGWPLDVCVGAKRGRLSFYQCALGQSALRSASPAACLHGNLRRRGLDLVRTVSVQVRAVELLATGLSALLLGVFLGLLAGLPRLLFLFLRHLLGSLARLLLGFCLQAQL